MGHLIACSLAKLLLPFSIIFFFFATTGVQYSQSIEFTYNGFNGSDLILHNEATVENPSGALRLTAGSFNKIGSAFFGQPIHILANTNTTTNVNASDDSNANASASSSFSFSTHFVFSIHPSDPDRRGGFGLVFVLSPTPKFPGAQSGQYLGIFNHTNDGDKNNSIFGVEFDTVKGHKESAESVGNHVGIDINGLASVASKPAGYHRLEENSPDKTEDLTLENGERVYAWIDYDGTKVAVTVSPTPTQPQIPLLAYQTDLKSILKETVYVGFSAATGAEKSSCHYLLGWSFRMNGGVADSLDVSRLPAPDPEDKNCNAANKSSTAALKASTKLLIIAALSAFLILSLGGLLFRKWYRRRYGDDEDMEAWELECPHRFRYRDLHAATKGFSDARVIGSGGFGAVYYGRLLLPSAGGEIAVKKISRDSVQGFKEFVSEIESLGRLRHKHLVNLQGWCKRKNDLLLVYDYVPRGSLDSLLCFGDTDASSETVLGWEQRLNILKGVAAGLLYMHEDWDRVVIHRDVKSSNVLVDDDMNGRLGDFGLARLYDRGSGGDSRPSLLTTAVVGTIGYIAPELTRTGKASTRSDVFAFGVLLMEVACGRRPVDLGSEPGHQLLVDRVMECQQMGRILDAADIRILDVEGFAGDEVERVLELGLVCCHPDPEARPSMRQVVRCLNGEPVPATENWSSGDSRRMNDINARFLEVISAGSCVSSSIGPVSTSSLSLEGGR